MAERADIASVAQDSDIPSISFFFCLGLITIAIHLQRGWAVSSTDPYTL